VLAARDDLPERIRRKILFDNTNRLYQLGL
jgi:hypothetical protein